MRCFWEPGLRLETDCRLMPDARARSRRKERAPRTEVRSALGLKPGTKLSGQFAPGEQRAARLSQHFHEPVAKRLGTARR